MTLNAIDQTLDEILDRITGHLDIRYHRRRGVLVIEPDTPVLRSYRIDYVNVVRDVPFEQLHRHPGVGRRRGPGEPRQQFVHRHRQPFEQSVLGDDYRDGARDRSRRLGKRRRLGTGAKRRTSRAAEPGNGTPARARDGPPAPRDPGIPRRGARQRTPPSAYRGDDRRGRAERSLSGRRRLEPARAQRRSERAAEPARRQPGGGAVLPVGLPGCAAGRSRPRAERDGAASRGVRQPCRCCRARSSWS